MYVAIGDEFTVNTTAARSQAHAELTRLADGRLLAVWIDADFNTTADRFVRAQFYAPDGTPSGGELTLVAAGSLIRPDVTGLADGGFALTWIGASAIRAQTFDAAGAAVAPPVTLNAPSASGDNQPDIASLNGGGYAVVWDDTRTSGGDASGSGIRLSLVGANGATLLNEIVVNSATDGNQADAAVTGLANGGFVVTWTDRGPRGAGATWLVKAQLFDATGARVGGELTVSDPATSPSAVEPTVAILSNGNFVVAWADGSAQHAQVFTAVGGRVGGDITVPGMMGGGAAVGPAVTSLANGGFALAWQDNGLQPGDGSGTAIFVQAYTAAAQPDGPVVRANSQADGNQIDPSIVGLANGGFMVSWTDLHGAGADDDDIHAQLFAPAPAPPRIEIVSDGGGDTAQLTALENGVVATQVHAVVTGGTAPVQYTIAGGDDAALFTIDEATGQLHFNTAPDFEAPADQGGDNVYDVTVLATAGDLSDSQQFAIQVTNGNEAPSLTGGLLGVTENAGTVAILDATDPDGDPLSFAIIGGPDAALFAIDAATGALRFLAAPDYEAPASADGSNDYRVTVSVSDGMLSDTRELVVRVGNIDEAPVFTSNGGGTSGTASIAENTTAVTVVRAIDPDGSAITYRIAGGADAGRFALAPDGTLRFLSAPDYETPRDANGDNRYEVVVEANDGTRTAQQTLLVSVTNLIEQVSFTSFGGATSAQLTVQENMSGVATLTAADADGGTVKFMIVGGADAGRFTVDPITGVLKFVAAPNFEAPTDADGDNRYDVVVQASNGQVSDTQTLSVAIGNVRDGVTLNGAAASETFSPTAGNPALRTTNAEDTIYARDGNDTIYGGAGDDRIDGGNGSDALIGGLDADELIGGTGADLFVYTSVLDSRAGDADRIYDFSRSQGDRISLSAIDANPYASGDQAFSFIGTNAFTGTAGQLRYVQSGGETTVFADLDGDRIADLQITLSGTMPLTAADFVL